MTTTAININRFGYPISFTVSFILYYGICKIWPTHNQKLIRDMGLGWEEMVTSTIDIDGLEVHGSSTNVTEVKISAPSKV